jgi:ABC-type uncharacterized transport system substrate-binding protein
MLAALALPASLQAHPHVWVTYTIKPVGGPNGISKIYFTWRFDAMFAEMVKGEFSLKTIGEKESAILRDKAFANLKNYHYYMHIKYDGVEFDPAETADFKARMAGKNLVYEFSVTLPKPAKNLELSIWDEEFYVDLDPPTEEIPNDKVGSAMREIHYRPKEFITPIAGPGGKAPECIWEQRMRDNQIWGKITTFTVLCKAKP